MAVGQLQIRGLNHCYRGKSNRRTAPPTLVLRLLRDVRYTI